MVGILGMVHNLIQEDIKKEYIKQRAIPEVVVTVFVSKLERILALSKLFKNKGYIKRSMHHLSFLLRIA
jgi:hypothetical protein